MFQQSAFKREQKNTINSAIKRPRTNFKISKIYCRPRLLLNYKIDRRNYTTLSGILEDYNVSGCDEEIFVFNAKEMGMILSEVFPEKTRVQRRENGNRTWKYPLSKKSQLDEDALKWKDLPHFTKDFGWLLSTTCTTWQFFAFRFRYFQPLDPLTQ